MTVHDGLSMLGQPVRGSITATQLTAETFPAPSVSVVEFATNELTALCPVTGQPDLYHLVFAYRPRGVCVESKALKMYLHRFRGQGMFAEALAATIRDDLVAALDPEALSVALTQQVRGGLTLTARALYQTEVVL